MALYSLIPNLCPRCHLRLLNVRTPSLYAKPSPSTAVPCPVCLGILQDPVLASISHQLTPHLARVRHNSHVKLTTTLPVAASVIRDRAARFHLSRSHALPPPHGPDISLREAVKWAVCARLQATHALQYAPDAELYVDLVFTHTPTAADSAAFGGSAAGPRSAAKKPRLDKAHTRRHPSATVVARTVAAMSDASFAAALPPHLLPPSAVSESVEVQVSVSVAPLLFAASYNKLSRVISQTPWFVDAPHAAQGLAAAVEAAPSNEYDKLPERDAHGRHKRTAVSVEDVAIAGITQVLRPEKATFTAGGREDVDVRMLGSGRPFVVEVLNPCVIPSLVTRDMVSRMAAISASVSESVVLRDFRLVSKDYFAQMRLFESEKRKCYRCVVWTSRDLPLAHLAARLQVPGGFLLRQKTPLRVLHRRTQAVRERQIFYSRVTRVVSPNLFVLDVVAAAGTYIKEFVHGDNGRTTPNVAMLLNCNADILQLDVTDIHCDLIAVAKEC